MCLAVLAGIIITNRILELETKNVILTRSVFFAVAEPKRSVHQKRETKPPIFGPNVLRCAHGRKVLLRGIIFSMCPLKP